VGNAQVGSTVLMPALALILDLRKSCLDVFGEIHIIGEVECSFILDFLNHVNIELVFGVYLHACIISKWNEQQLLDSVYIGSKNLSNERSLLDDDKIAINCKLEITEHSIYFLYKRRCFEDFVIFF